ncbi:hypothetical protein HanXRQr2_Chr13g0579381 [Helianthus annuus]|uniref:Uncharacterized protein n=1 Tax=Helianthus annuus TaxID=4232 RepID=A0A9K3HBQ1_HELAN|nr:hypothetical protein HanXRQr2_Chr13g0579381 [Helianthus annuus]KAJ0476244.1 hypothetical protein HanHA300_Chr13g0475111 [Helianthus annuus]KAJ0480359.1 hypothetical protein HanIR_Chr13g0630701 [Helianthus annuus]KAJ0497051.1 hypothetical protein HanHA89_Chr13g0507031 [Helianthus annuus]
MLRLSSIKWLLIMAQMGSLLKAQIARSIILFFYSGEWLQCQGDDPALSADDLVG